MKSKDMILPVILTLTVAGGCTGQKPREDNNKSPLDVVSECAGNFGNWKECVEKVQSNQELTMERSLDESGKKIILVKDEAGNVLFRISGAQDY